MLVIGPEALDRALDAASLVAALAEAFRGGAPPPLRHHHSIATPDGEATLLVMPAWTDPAAPDAALGVKIVSLMPGNPRRGLPFIQGSYMLFDGATGVPRAVLDGPMLTARRTAAASALAARHLARVDARRLAMIGAGVLAAHVVRAHAAMRTLDDIAIWARDPAKAERLAATLRAEGLPARAAADRAAAVRQADIVSAATRARTPLVEGDWLRPGTHLDLIGAYTPEMRESDDAAVRRASVFVDTRDGALAEAGDLIQAIAAGAFTADAIAADLHDLARGTHPGRRDAQEITLFKSVGTAIADLAAARLAFDMFKAGSA